LSQYKKVLEPEKDISVGTWLWRHGWDAAKVSLFSPKQMAYDHKRLIKDPQPAEARRAFAFMGDDVSDPRVRHELMQTILKPGKKAPPDFEKDMATMPIDAFVQKYGDQPPPHKREGILQPVKIEVGSRPVKFDGRDFGSRDPNFHLPDLDSGQNHIFLRFSIGDKSVILDGYQTSANGSKNASMSGTIYSKLFGKKNSVKMFLDDNPKAGVETITEGYHGENTRYDTIATMNLADGMRAYHQALQYGAQINQQERNYDSGSMNGNTAIRYIVEKMKLKLPASMDTKRGTSLLDDGKTKRSVPGISDVSRDKLVTLGAPEPQKPKAATMLDFAWAVGQQQHEVHKTQPTVSRQVPPDYTKPIVVPIKGGAAGPHRHRRVRRRLSHDAACT